MLREMLSSLVHLQRLLMVDCVGRLLSHFLEFVHESEQATGLIHCPFTKNATSP
jgi:hypothetical protein